MSQTLSVLPLLAVPLAPLVGSIAAGVLGTKFGGNTIGRRASHTLTIAGVLIAFVISVMTLNAVAFDGARFNETLYTWMVVGDLKMEIGFLIDGLSAMMMCVVTFVSLMVHIYTIGYMQEDDGYNRFFSYISLFTFSMLMLVMSNNMLQLFFGWEAVGLVSYLLIGFWFNKPTAIFANMKAFLVNRVGDFGFILGIGLIAAFAGTLNYGEVFARSSQLAALIFPGTDWMLITVICICLFVGAMGKSAQFPLHVWLPDSMEGPTPISALIHAATMVTAGIFMVARMSPLFELSDAALNFILVIGSITALFMGFLGIIQNDIKRVVAYSTLSQLGYMTVALGASAYSVAVFHLMTHAFFKALLFLGAGSVIMGVHHNQDIRWMGGLRKYMPITWMTSLLGSLALIGTPFFAGFYSKDSIIEVVHASHLPGAGFANFAVLAGVFVTAFYSFRMYFLVFHGKERFDQNPAAHHDDHGGHGHAHVPHESPWVVWVPLVLLAVPSVVIGYLTIGPMLFGDFFKDSIFVDAAKHGAMSELREMFHGSSAMALHSISTLPLWLAVAGVVSAYYMYMVNPALPAAIKRTFMPIFNLLENKYYLDWINENILARGARALGTGLWKGGDQAIIDGTFVNGSWKLVSLVSGAVRKVQTGYLYHYALVMILGIFVLMTYFVWLKEENNKMGLLSLAIWTPVAFGVVLLALGRDEHAPMVRWFALIGALVSFLVTLPLYIQFNSATAAMQFVEDFAWIERFNVRYHLGIDGISIWFVLLTAFINVVVIIASWESITRRVNQYMGAFLILSGLMVGVFCTLDGLLFYVFFEATLIPMYLIIGIWGGPNKIYAAFKFFLYTLLGSLLMLVALIFLYTKSGGSFDLAVWHSLPLDGQTQTLLFFAFFAAFAVKVPMWPVHTWLPDVHVEAPTGGSAVLAAIMLKLGAYGFLRFSLPIAPDAAHEWAWLMIGLSLTAVVYVGLVAMVQEDMKKLVAYSSVAHMGFVTLGFFVFIDLGISGGLIQMIAHGFVSGAMFLSIGVLYDRVHSRKISSYGGVVNTMPKFAAFALFFSMANCGLPGTAGFVGEWMVILAAVKFNFWVGFAAASALIFGAAYTLWMFKRVYLGPVANDDVKRLVDINSREFLMLSLLAVAVLWMGVYPRPFTDAMDVSVAQLLKHVAVSKLN